MQRLTSLGVLVLSFVMAGGCEDPTTVAGGHSVLLPSVAALDFGRVYLGATASRTFTLRAQGELPVAYRLSFAGPAPGYEAGPSSALIRAGAELMLTVRFRPGAVGPAPANLAIDSDATDTDQLVIRLSATGIEPPDCEDGNGCTVDVFDPVAGRCDHRAERLSCNDFNACTGLDTCLDGICRGESQLCDDGDSCTDDLCDPASGCVFVATRSCDDENPCTADVCMPGEGCAHRSLEDGTPCDDLELCTSGDICLRGHCIGVVVPEGFRCDDGDPCSKEDQCIQGKCRDPNYTPPLVGEVKFATAVGRLAPGAANNPVIDRDGRTYAGLAGGLVAVDACGEVVWSVASSTPTWAAASAIPSALVVPIGDRVVDFDPATGALLRQVVVGELFAPLPVATASTASRAATIVDLAVRSSGALIVSVTRPTATTAGAPVEGMIAEIDRSHRVATVFRHLGRGVARRLAIDRDESLVAVITDGQGRERLVRFGLLGLAAGSWSTTADGSSPSELALAEDGAVIWTRGLVTVGSTGTLQRLLPDEPGWDFASGSPVLRSGAIMVLSRPPAQPQGLGPGLFAPGGGWELLAVRLDLPRTSTRSLVYWRSDLGGSAEASSPAMDQSGNALIVTRDGLLSAYDPAGTRLFQTVLPLDPSKLERLALGISSEKVITLVADGKIIGVRGPASLGVSAWPRHRRDNLSTGHR